MTLAPMLRKKPVIRRIINVRTIAVADSDRFDLHREPCDGFAASHTDPIEQIGFGFVVG